MDKLTREAMQWLDWRYRVGVAEGRYQAHEPIYGVACHQTDGNHAGRLARAYCIFRRLAQLRFETLLDVGGSEGYHASLARRLLSARAVTSDLSTEAARRARELFGLPAVGADAHWLPYGDDSFDVVLCCEVLEHVADPVAVMSEALRVARRYVVFSTEELAQSARAREIHLLLAGRPYPHAERNWFLSTDFPTVLGDKVTCERQGVATDRYAELVVTRKEPREDEVRDLVLEMTRLDSPLSMEYGILVVKAKGDAPPLDTLQPGDPALLDAILEHRVSAGQPAQHVAPDADAFLQEQLACPICLVPLRARANSLTCAECDREFAVEEGIPRLHGIPTAAEASEAPRRRWPWLTPAAQELRAMFTAPRKEPSRLLCHLLNVELGLLALSQGLQDPGVDGLNSGAVRNALMTPPLRSGTEPHASASRAMWWDELPASEAEIEAMRALSCNALKLRCRVEALSRERDEVSRQLAALSQHLDRIYSRWPVRIALRLKRLWGVLRRK